MKFGRGGRPQHGR